MRIAMFVYNACVRDARVLKEARTLAEAGHEVEVVAVLDATSPPQERRDGFSIVRIDRNPPHYRLLRRTRQARRAARLTTARARRQGMRLGRIVDGIVNRQRGAALAPAGGEAPVSATAVRGMGAALLPLYLVIQLARRLAQSGAPRVPARAFGAVSRLSHRTLMRFHKPLMFSDYYLRARRHVRRRPPDAYHAHDLNTLPVAAWLARETGGRLVYDSHELYPDVSTLSELESSVWRRIERALVTHADEVITVCESIAEELARRYPIEKPTVLLNCPPRIETPAAAGRDLLRERAGVAPGTPLILYQGGFAPNRGLPSLVRAAAQLDDGVVVMMGWGRIEDELRLLVEELHLQERVRIVGPVPQEELFAYTAGADIGVIPYEPVGLNNTFTTPNKLFELMAAGVPIVASRLPEIIRFVEGLDVGLTFQRAEPELIAAAINALLADPAARERMSRNGREASLRLCWEVESRKLLEVYGPAAVSAPSAAATTAPASGG